MNIEAFFEYYFGEKYDKACEHMNMYYVKTMCQFAEEYAHKKQIELHSLYMSIFIIIFIISFVVGIL